MEKFVPSVNEEFMGGNFVVKRCDNQFQSDQNLHVCKMDNGIIGITINDQTKDKYFIT